MPKKVESLNRAKNKPVYDTFVPAQWFQEANQRDFIMENTSA